MIQLPNDILVAIATYIIHSKRQVKTNYTFKNDDKGKSQVVYTAE